VLGLRVGVLGDGDGVTLAGRVNKTGKP